MGYLSLGDEVGEEEEAILQHRIKACILYPWIAICHKRQLNIAAVSQQEPYDKR